MISSLIPYRWSVSSPQLTAISRSSSSTTPPTKTPTIRASHLLLIVKMQLLLRPFLFVGILLLAKTTAVPVSSRCSTSSHPGDGEAGACLAVRTLPTPRRPFPADGKGKASCDIRHYPAPTSPPREGPFSQYDDQVSEALKILWTPDFWVETEATSDESLWVPSATVSDDQFSELVRTFLFDRKEDVTLVAVTEVSTGTILHVVVFEGNSFDKGHVVFRPGKIFFHFAKGKYWFPGSEETKMSFPTYKMREINSPNFDGHFVTYERPCHREPAQIQPPPESQPPTVQRNRNSRGCSIGFMFSIITFPPFRKAHNTYK
ncbi:hypothetical protein FB446DRAFT_711688 [Lentinula raphanica]|nr:hypothetical protein FB446DRAFT_711688 [Lentinula raphanica]